MNIFAETPKQDIGKMDEYYDDTVVYIKRTEN